jgi:hypothetical protein
MTDSFILCWWMMMQIIAPTQAPVSSGYKAQLGKSIMERVTTCEQIHDHAVKHDVNKYLVLSIAFHESKFVKSAVSDKGAVGAMQIIPKYKPCAKCSDSENGVLMLKKMLDDQGGDECKAIGFYATGKVLPKCGRYGKSILKLSQEIYDYAVLMGIDEGC